MVRATFELWVTHYITFRLFQYCLPNHYKQRVHRIRSESVPSQKRISTKSLWANQVHRIRSESVLNTMKRIRYTESLSAAGTPNQKWISTESEVNQYRIRSKSVPNHYEQWVHWIRSESVLNQKRISTESEANQYWITTGQRSKVSYI